jgi:pimeloyl-ACP methyl ester carboxylesterase
MEILFAEVPFEGQVVRLEYAWLNRDRAGAPLIVFLHEGLGCVAMWRDFPRRVCDACGCRGLVYSRYGYGGSTPRPRDEGLPVDFLEREAREALPAFLRAVGADARPWLFGHSDGASIALLYAAAFPQALGGAVVLAPHIAVEDVTITGIIAAKRMYEATDLQQRLARYHPDPDAVFAGWHERWLDPAFRGWSIEALLPAIRCPLLAVQGFDDEYGSMAQLDGIKRRVPQTELLKLVDCRHSPHRDQPQAVIEATRRFVFGDTQWRSGLEFDRI